MSPERQVGLLGLPHLKRLSWRRLKVPEDLEILGRVSRQNRHKLVGLELDYIDWEAIDHWTDQRQSYLAWEVLESLSPTQL